MALTADQKAAVRAYLGYEDFYGDYASELESKMIALSPGGETRVTAILTKLAALDAAIDAVAVSGDGEFASLNRGEIVFREGNEGTRNSQEYGRTLIQQLSIVFGVKPQCDYYGAGDTGGMIQLG